MVTFLLFVVVVVLLVFYFFKYIIQTDPHILPSPHYIYFIGISQANWALTKPSRAKIWSKMFPLKTCLDLLYLLSLSLSHI